MQETLRTRDHFVYVPSQWKTLYWNIISHLLGAYTKWSLRMTTPERELIDFISVFCCFFKWCNFQMSLQIRTTYLLLITTFMVYFRTSFNNDYVVPWWHHTVLWNWVNINPGNAWRLTAPSHYLSQSWLSQVRLIGSHLKLVTYKKNVRYITQYNVHKNDTHFNLQLYLPGDNESNSLSLTSG